MILAGISLSAAACWPRGSAVVPGDPAAEPPPAAEVRPVFDPDDTAQPQGPRETSWPRLFLRAAQIGSDEIAASAAGLAATEQERALDPSLQSDESAEELRRRLLVLDYLRRSPLLDDAEFEARMRARLRAVLVEEVLDTVLNGSMTVTEDEARRRYDDRIADYTNPARASIQLILVPTEEQAAEVLQRLRDGADFGRLATEVSQHGSSSSGGRIESFSPGTLSPSIEELAFSLSPGELGSVVTQRGVFIIQKIAGTPESRIPFEEVRETIIRTLQEEKRLEAETRFLESLRGNTAE